jgi:hypothetical protein
MFVLEILAAAILPMIAVIVFAEFIGWLCELRDKIELKRRNR